MADAVGAQTETLIIRGLSVGIPIRHVVRREILAGLLVGLALSLAFFPDLLRHRLGHRFVRHPSTGS
jgi:magnesium transporter